MTHSDNKNFYQVLDLSLRASHAEIKAQYRLLVHAWHPDKFPTPDQKVKAGEKMREINAAYAVLGDLSKRAEYDRLLGLQSTTRATVSPRARQAAREPKARQPQTRGPQQHGTRAKTEDIKATQAQYDALLLLRERWRKLRKAISAYDKPVGALVNSLLVIGMDSNTLRLQASEFVYTRYQKDPYFQGILKVAVSAEFGPHTAIQLEIAPRRK
jgi:curved DNA-binding protein CbpA